MPEPLREAVADIWRASLGVTEVNDEDNFFFEGGHSVLAVEAAMSLRELTGTELALDLLYEYPEFGALLAVLEAGLPGAGRGAERELTPAEERLWFVEQLHRGTPVYHVSALYRFDGKLRPARLREALDTLAARHEALRRGFEAPGRAFALGGATVPLRQLDATGAPDATLRRLLDEEARQPFDLGRPPLLRALLVDRGADGDLLLLTLHHLVCDGLSLSLLEAELQELYEGGAPSAAVPVAQAVSPRLQDGAAALAHWRGALAGLPPGGPSLPYDRPRPRVLGVTGRVNRAEPAPELLGAVAALAEQERLSPFMTWVAAYLTGLVAVTGDRDLVIAVPVSARGPEQRTEVGMFVDTLPLRFTVPPGATARSLVRLVRRVVTQALAHQQVSFQAMVEELGLGGDLARAPLAQLAISYLDEAGPGLRADGARAERELLATGTAKYELLWNVTRRGESVLAELEYNTALFSPEAAAALHRRLLAAVSTAFGEPDAVLPAFPGRSEAGRAGERYRAVPELVHRQALARPEAVAVQDGERSLSYRELDERASRVAAGLTAAGLRRGAVVAVPMGRGAEAVTACLGVLRAGCAYLPIDAGQPEERLRLIVRSAAEAAVVTDRTTAERLSDLLPVHLLSRLSSSTTSSSKVVDEPILTEEDAAYVISTSGSTGRPKGVVVPHGAITRLVPDADYVSLTAADRVAHLSNPAFDAATFEIWGALTSGATLVVVEREVALSPARLRAFLQERRITVLFLTTALLNQVVDFAPDAFQHLRALLFGGERHDSRRLERLLTDRPPARLVHVYGPTENTTFSTYHDVTLADLAAGTVPIGRAISGTTAYVLGPDAAPVEVGEAGELHLGGAGLARGYHDAPQTTADAFVPDPFDPRGGRRLYRTGDQVRLLADGGFEFLGRADDQVKVRGFRVELGEIELALRRRPEVADAVVVSRATEDGAELLAYVTASGRAELDAAGLTERLSRELPHYMVPTVLVLDRMPVNANGKIDRAALPAAATAHPAAEQHTASEAAPVEAGLLAELAELYREVLGIDRVGPEDNFFTLGGHSLKALRLLARIDEEFGVQLELAAFFEHPTLLGIAAQLLPQVPAEDAAATADHESVRSTDASAH